jgi:predicted NUDIX family phosphoesterase
VRFDAGYGERKEHADADGRPQILGIGGGMREQNGEGSREAVLLQITGNEIEIGSVSHLHTSRA